MSVLSYVRVSGAAQVDKGGPDRQREAIVNFCINNKLSLPSQEYFDEGVSGTIEGIDRPELSKLFQRVAEEPNCIIVAENMDRIARDLLVSEYIIREFRKHGAKVYCADQGGLNDMAADGGDEGRVFIRQVMGAIAQLNKSQAVKRLKAGRQRKRELTGRCEGILAYGLKNNEEAVIADLIMRLYEQHVTINQIFALLNDAGHRTRTGKPWAWWSTYTVATKRNLKKKV